MSRSYTIDADSCPHCYEMEEHDKATHDANLWWYHKDYFNEENRAAFKQWREKYEKGNR